MVQRSRYSLRGLTQMLTPAKRTRMLFVNIRLLGARVYFLIYCCAFPREQLALHSWGLRRGRGDDADVDAIVCPSSDDLTFIDLDPRVSRRYTRRSLLLFCARDP